MTLFCGHRELILDFNQFLPPGHTIELADIVCFEEYGLDGEHAHAHLRQQRGAGPTDSPSNPPDDGKWYAPLAWPECRPKPNKACRVACWPFEALKCHYWFLVGLCPGGYSWWWLSGQRWWSRY